MEVWEPKGVFEYPVQGKTKEAAIHYLEADDFTPVSPKYAASVMVLRNKTEADIDRAVSKETDRVEVFMLRRAKTMAFVPTAVVFPGGRVDLRDSDPPLPWVGPSSQEWACQLGVDEQLARCIVVAAAREVFEECGVLLAGSDEHKVIDDLTDEKWDEARAALASHEQSFAELLLKQGLILRSDLLGFRSRWLTPEFEQRRYDTFFFAALLPDGQIPDDRTSEATQADWTAPLHVLHKAEVENILLLPPTRYNLFQLAHAASAEEFVSEMPKATRIMPEPRFNKEGTVVLQCVLP